MYYIKEFLLEEKDFDLYGNLLPFKVFDIFEKGATTHGELLGVGEKTMSEKNLFWVISQIKYKVIKNPKPEDRVVLKTWPIEPSGIGFLREYLILDSLGETLIMGSANWLTISRDDRKLKIGERVFPEMEFSKELNFGKKIPRLRETSTMEKVYSVTINKNHIDSNSHVNNKHYTTFIKDALGGFTGEIDLLQIDYIQEIMPDDSVEIFLCKNDKEYLIKGESNLKKHFLAKVIYK